MVGMRGTDTKIVLGLNKQHRIHSILTDGLVVVLLMHSNLARKTHKEHTRQRK